MSVAGALIGNAIGAFGKKPVVPNLTPIDINKVQSDTVSGNQSNFADIAKLATSVDTFNQDQLNALIDRVLPGARDQIASTLSSQLKGEVPTDVRNAIYRSNAERGVGSAFGGNYRDYINARDIGRTSLDITNQALSSVESWLAKATAPTFDVSSMFFSPQQRLAFQQNQQQLQFNRDLLKAGVDAAPDPGTAALGTEIDRFFNTWAQVGMGALGGGMGGLAGGAGGVGSAGGQGLPGLGKSSINPSASGLGMTSQQWEAFANQMGWRPK